MVKVPQYSEERPQCQPLLRRKFPRSTNLPKIGLTVKPLLRRNVSRSTMPQKTKVSRSTGEAQQDHNYLTSRVPCCSLREIQGTGNNMDLFHLSKYQHGLIFLFSSMHLHHFNKTNCPTTQSIQVGEMGMISQGFNSQTLLTIELVHVHIHSMAILSIKKVRVWSNRDFDMLPLIIGQS